MIGRAMVIQIIVNGKIRSTETVPDGLDERDAKRLALSAAIEARHLTISEALRAQFVVVDGRAG
jgi:hypothetical protein